MAVLERCFSSKIKVFQGACLEQLSLISGGLLSNVVGRGMASSGMYSAAVVFCLQGVSEAQKNKEARQGH